MLEQFFFFVLDVFFCCSGGGRVTESHQKKTQKHPTRSVLYHCHNFSSRGNLFFFFFSNSVIRFCSHGLTRSPSLMEGGGVRGFAGGREGGKGGWWERALLSPALRSHGEPHERGEH